MRHAVIVTAAGSSCRFNEHSEKSQKKEFISLEGHTVLYRAVEPFTEVDGLCAIAITYRKNTLEETEKALEDLTSQISVPVLFVEGGETRQRSVFNALKALYEKNGELQIDYVSIHDGARPFVTKQLIGFTLAAALQYGAAAPAVSVNDTLIRTDGEGFICGRLDRTNVCRIQTPQIFRFPDILEAHVAAAENGEKKYTDDTEIYTDYGRKVAIVEGSPDNIKITFRKDLC